MYKLVQACTCTSSYESYKPCTRRLVRACTSCTSLYKLVRGLVRVRTSLYKALSSCLYELVQVVQACTRTTRTRLVRDCTSTRLVQACTSTSLYYVRGAYVGREGGRHSRRLRPPSPATSPPARRARACSRRSPRERTSGQNQIRATAP